MSDFDHIPRKINKTDSSPVWLDMEDIQAQGGAGDCQEDQGEDDVDIEQLFYFWHSVQVFTYC